MEHEPDIEKAFQAFFNQWVERQTSQDGPAPSPSRPARRRQVRDDALSALEVLISRVTDDRLMMVRFENGDSVL